MRAIKGRRKDIDPHKTYKLAFLCVVQNTDRENVKTPNFLQSFSLILIYPCLILTTSNKKVTGYTTTYCFFCSFSLKNLVLCRPGIYKAMCLRCEKYMPVILALLNLMFVLFTKFPSKTAKRQAYNFTPAGGKTPTNLT